MTLELRTKLSWHFLITQTVFSKLHKEVEGEQPSKKVKIRSKIIQNETKIDDPLQIYLPESDMVSEFNENIQFIPDEKILADFNNDFEQIPGQPPLVNKDSTQIFDQLNFSESEILNNLNTNENGLQFFEGSTLDFFNESTPGLDAAWINELSDDLMLTPELGNESTLTSDFSNAPTSGLSNDYNEATAEFQDMSIPIRIGKSIFF